MPKMVNPIFQEYVLECTHLGCKGKKTLDHAVNGGWVVGEIVPEDSSCPDLARCFMCKRHIMRVVKGPEKPKPPGPVGWTKVPTK